MPHFFPTRFRNAAAFAALACLGLTSTGAQAEIIRLDEMPLIVDFAFTSPAPDVPDDRHVVLNEDLVEIIYALGQQDRIVAQVPVHGLPMNASVEETFSTRPNVEGVAALNPSLTLGSHFRFSPEVLDALPALGLEGKFIDARLPAPEKIRILGEVLGVSGRAEELAASIEADYGRMPEHLAQADKLRVIQFSNRGGSGRVTGSGKDTAANTLMEIAGGNNVGAEAGLERYKSVTPEGVVQMAPEAIIVSDAELEAMGGEEGIWETVPGLGLTPAAQTRNLIVMHDQHIRNNAASSGAAALALADAFITLND